jgi:hypothetical protein
MQVNTRKLTVPPLVPILLTLLLSASLGCSKKVVTSTTPPPTPVPGSTSALDAYAFRVLDDAQAALLSLKVWELCSLNSFPMTVVVDGNTQVCDPKSGPFPPQFKQPLNDAITAEQTTAALARAYHAGTSSDGAGLSAAITQLETSITNLLSAIGGKP